MALIPMLRTVHTAQLSRKPHGAAMSRLYRCFLILAVQDDLHVTALQAASAHGHKEIVQMLLDREADDSAGHGESAITTTPATTESSDPIPVSTNATAEEGLASSSKQHKWENPHICNECGRRFARGDALARHCKADGGCAGRRSNMSGDQEEDDDELGRQGIDGMKNIVYSDDQHDDDPTYRHTEPSRKRAHIEDPHDSARPIYHRNSDPPPVRPTNLEDP
ncbi:hypothetical protein E4T49_07425 [Aureobasidium sp. EXF-10728]|nr:hypothetical protein E4T49_07425 [Aureobasidium sp. EXF-10728]